MDNTILLASTNSLVSSSILLMAEAEELSSEKTGDCLSKAEDLFKKIQIIRLISILKLIGENEALNEILAAEEDALQEKENQLSHGDYAELASYFLPNQREFEDISSSSSPTFKGSGIFKKLADLLALKRRG